MVRFSLGVPFSHLNVAIRRSPDRFGVVCTSAECIASPISSAPLRAEVRSTSFRFEFSYGAEVANLAQADLTNAFLGDSRLKNANLAGAVVAGTDFRDTTSRGFTKEQLYSTASYADKKLRGIGLGNNDLTGWDFSDQDLSYANIVGAMLTNANLAGANLFGADLREAEGFSPAASTTTRNAIWPDGQIRRLELRAGEYLPIGFFRDFEAGTPVEDVFAAADGATLEVLIGNFGELFDPYPVSSRLLLGSHVPVELGGSLRVVWEDGGFPKRGSYDLFDWPGPLEPDNVFSFLELPPGAWDVSQLYNSGQITLTDEYRDDGDFDADGLLGADDIDRLSTAVRAGRDLSYDANGDGLLNQDDRRLWVEELKDTFIGDANFDGVVNAADLNELALNWRAAKPAANTIPEPRGIALAAISLVAFSVLGRIRQDALIATKSR